MKIITKINSLHDGIHFMKHFTSNIMDKKKKKIKKNSENQQYKQWQITRPLRTPG